MVAAAAVLTGGGVRLVIIKKLQALLTPGCMVKIISHTLVFVKSMLMRGIVMRGMANIFQIHVRVLLG